jgi:hypothetical protein
LGAPKHFARLLPHGADQSASRSSAAKNNEVSATRRGMAVKNVAGPRKSRKLKSSTAAEFRLWTIVEAVLRCSNQIAYEQEETRQAEDEAVYLPEGSSRGVPPMAISVGRCGKIAAPSYALANRRSWPRACLVPGAVLKWSNHTKFLVTRRRACERDTALRAAR